ncbi:MAG TPA: hypothetical protein VKS24_00210 [Bradyrhizobium sp.]|nr:hypothetical protein [Bradyrhizobium sp.]
MKTLSLRAIKFNISCSLFLFFFAPATLAQEQPKIVACKPGTSATLIERHKNSDLYKYFDKKCNNHPDLAAYNAWLDAKNPLAEHDEARRRQAHLPPLEIKTPATETPSPGGWKSYFLLRDSFQDISVFGNPKPASSASGATFGWTRDDIGSNTSWSAKGVAAYPVVWQNPTNPEPRSSFDPYVVGFALSPSVNFQRVTDSNPKFAKNNIDILTYGGTGEVGIGHMFDETTTHYFRTRTSAVGTFEGDIHSWSETLEYQPITEPVDPRIPSIGAPNGLFGLPATYELDAIGRLQYAERAAMTTDPLFGKQDRLTRGGVVLALTIAPQQGPDSPVSKTLQRISFTASYSWLKNLATDEEYAHFLAALGFALDEAGNVGIKVSYEQGKIEDTGQNVKLSKVGLTAKF